MIPPVQKDFDVRAAGGDCLLESALTPLLEPVQCRLNMFAGSQAVDAVVEAVAAVNGFLQRTNLDTIALSTSRVYAVDTKEIAILYPGFDPDGFIGATQTAAFDFIIITGGPA
jgi:hypothetical protein